MNRAKQKAPGKEPPAYRAPQLNLMREVKVDSPVHRMWAGTKLLIVAALSVTLSYFPSWVSIGSVAVLLLTGAVAGRIPAGAWPRPPRWFFGLLLASAALTAAAGGKPHVQLAGLRLGLGGIDSWAKFVSIGVLLLLAALLLGWTTPLGEIAPAMSRLLSPLKLLRVPVEEWAVTIALCVRSLPLLMGEMRTLMAARRLRPAPERPTRSELEKLLDQVVDVMVAALAVSVRRGGELAEAITARGGTGMFAAPTRRPGWADGVALAVTAGVCVAACTLP